MCDVVNEIELERERCENRTAGNITSGKVYKSWDAEGHPTRWLYNFNIVIVCRHFPFKPLMQCQLVDEKLFFAPAFTKPASRAFESSHQWLSGGFFEL